MRVFIFEFGTGGGWFLIDDINPPSGSLLREGRAMVEAVASDFAAIDGVQMTTLTDARLNDSPTPLGNCRSVSSAIDLQKQFVAAAAGTDFTLVIAPEFDWHLAKFASQVLGSGGRLLGPSPRFIRLASDKHRITVWLSARSVPTPQGIMLSPDAAIPINFPIPAVLKPNDGAGSLNVKLVANAAQDLSKKIPAASRLEQFCPGTPVSVAAICGPQGITLLPPCLQKLSDDGRFTYLGGECPIDDVLAKRANRLAELALDSLPSTTGYVGIDMVLGEDPSGDGDVVIEVNPRLTTSYVGLRALIRENLAGAMLSAAQGQSIELSSHRHRVEFSADGNVNILSE